MALIYDDKSKMITVAWDCENKLCLIYFLTFNIRMLSKLHTKSSKKNLLASDFTSILNATI